LRPRPQPGGAREVAAEFLSGPAKRLVAAVGRQLVEQAPDERGEPARWEFERLRLDCGRVELRGATGAGALSAGATLEPGLEKPGTQEPLEPTASDAAVDAEAGRGVVGGDGARRSAHVQERLAQLASADGVEGFQLDGNPRPLRASCLE